MQLKEREAIIQRIVEESNQASKQAGKKRVLVEWRAKLEKEPILLGRADRGAGAVAVAGAGRRGRRGAMR